MPAATSTPTIVVVFRLFGYLAALGGLVVLMLSLDELTLSTTAAMLAAWVVTTAVLLGFAECIALLGRMQR